jgi:WD40 repeat protein
MCAGQKGIISELKFNPQRTDIYAAGSYAHSIGLYAEHESSAAKSCLMHISDLPFGVTCLRWSPCGNLLWAGGRKLDAIVCYDIRNSFEEVGRCVNTT